MSGFSRGVTSALVVLALSALCASSALAEPVDNPRYQAWSKFKVGSSHTLAGTIDAAGGIQVQMELAQKLVDLTAEQAVIETTSTMVLPGQPPRANPPQRKTIPAKAEATDARDLGPENVEAMGKTFNCKLLKVTGEEGPPAPGSPPSGAPGTAKLWIAPEVPGGVVKMEVKGKDPQGGDVVLTFLLKAFEAK